MNAPPVKKTEAIAMKAAMRNRAIDRLAHAHDAPHYLLVPESVAVAESVAAIAHLMEEGTRRGVPVTFRSGATSLSGQAQSAGILVDTRRHFRGIEVLDEGRRLRVEPGRRYVRSTPVSRRTSSSWGQTREASPPARSAW